MTEVYNQTLLEPSYDLQMTIHVNIFGPWRGY